MDSSISGGSSNLYSSSGVPRCSCRQPMKMWVANTTQNMNRKFWKCRNAGVRIFAIKLSVFAEYDAILICLCLQSMNCCDLFIWDDEVVHTMIDCTKNDIGECKKCEVALMKFEMTAKKLEKAKLKIVIMQRKNFQMKLALWLCWILLAVVISICKSGVEFSLMNVM